MNEPWLPPLSREARNEQRKLRGAVFNAMAIALSIAGLFGSILNPSAAALLTGPVRMGLIVGAVLLHLLACVLVRDMEDRP